MKNLDITRNSVDYSWCYKDSPANTCSKVEAVVSNCTMCDEHYVYCPDDCMID